MSMNIAKTTHKKTVKEVLKLLNSQSNGISPEDAKKRLLKYGPNTLEKQKQVSPFFMLFSQFKSPFVLILIFAGFVSIYLREFIDAAVIIFTISLNILVGFVQEFKASNAFNLLAKNISEKTVVLRDGIKHEIEAMELVPGDIIILKYGDKIPADARIISQTNLQVDQSALTGESIPQVKHSRKIDAEVSLIDKANMVYMGTTVVLGGCQAIVVSTAAKTEFGQIAKYVQEHKTTKSFVQKEINKLIQTLFPILGIMIFSLFLLGLFRGMEFHEILLGSVALAVAAIPESLPVAITIIFAIGMQRILKKKGLIKKLIATETLGRAEILCIDKTGTLTQGKMDVTQIITLDEEISLDQLNPESASKLSKQIAGVASITNEAFLEENIFRGSPTDVALLKLGHRFGYSKDLLLEKTPIREYYPFDSKSKFSRYIVEDGKHLIGYITGAPETLLDSSIKISSGIKDKKLEESTKTEMLSRVSDLAGQGYRVIAIATGSDESVARKESSELKNLTFLGLLVISDPLRESAKETVSKALQAGLHLVIVTGDHPEIARTIASKVGLLERDSQVLTDEQLNELSDDELDETIENIAVFARLSPTDKVRIINSWQRKDKIVTMTGDGVNDAPALNLADIGVALGSGTGVAKEAADIVLLDDDLKTILAAIEEGRGILDNIKKVVAYLLSDSFAEIILVGFTIIFGYPLAILPLQILWINFIEDGLPAVALASENTEKDVMKLKPKHYKRPILDKEVKIIAFLISWIDDIVLIGLFLYLYHNGFSIEYTRTMIFAALAIDSLFFAYACKNLKRPLWEINVFSNKLLNISFVVGLVSLLAAIYLPFFQTILDTVALGAAAWGILLVIGLLELLLLEIVKAILARRKYWD